MKRMIAYILTVAGLLVGQVTEAKDKPVQERGWIGGTYDCARAHCSWAERCFGADHTLYTFPTALAKSQGAGIFIASLATNTPASLGGLRAGDLILALNDQPVRDLPAFWQAVNGSKPGSPLPVKAYRAGQTVSCQLTVGREKFKSLGYFTIGLPGYWEPFHPIPTREAPSFSLMALGYEHPDARPVEFDTVKETYEHNCHPKDKQSGYDADWRFWLAIFEVKKGKQIVAQEVVSAAGQ